MSQEFIDAMATAERRYGRMVDFIVDTNVVAEMYSFGDLIRVAHQSGSVEVLRRSRSFDYRRQRARHSIVLAHWFAKNRIRAASLGNEVIDLLTERLAPQANAFSYDLTTAILRIIIPFALDGWCVDPLVNVNHRSKGRRADDEILRVATTYNIRVITWEGFTELGVVRDATKLRDRCIAASVPVFTPEELLSDLGVDVEREARHFLFWCEKAVRKARSLREFEGKGIVEKLVPIYRLVLLGENAS
jgi:hypothetical protein